MQKNTTLLILFSTLLPSLTRAQEMESVGPATFAGSITLWIAIILGSFASIIIIRQGFIMSGSRVGIILNFIGFGMLFVVLGFLSVVITWATVPVQKIVHDLLFIIGYLFMFIGALRIRNLNR